MVGVLVSQYHDVRANVPGRQRRQGKPFETVQPLDGVGKIGIGEDDFAGGGFEGKAGAGPTTRGGPNPAGLRPSQFLVQAGS